jgi:hypothetical protein
LGGVYGNDDMATKRTLFEYVVTNAQKVQPHFNTATYMAARRVRVEHHTNISDSPHKAHYFADLCAIKQFTLLNVKGSLRGVQHSESLAVLDFDHCLAF